MPRKVLPRNAKGQFVSPKKATVSDFWRQPKDVHFIMNDFANIILHFGSKEIVIDKKKLMKFVEGLAK